MDVSKTSFFVKYLQRRLLSFVGGLSSSLVRFVVDLLYNFGVYSFTHSQMIYTSKTKINL